MASAGSSAGHGSGGACRLRWRYDVIPIRFDGVLHTINDAGEYAGQRLTSVGTTHAVHVSRSGVTDLGTLGGQFSSARGINDSGVIVGGALTTDDEASHAFLYVGGVMHDLNDLIDADCSWELVQALGINNRGDIVALGHCGDADRVVLLRRRC
jgi:probable HAF family extracellular repeat protein